MFVLVNYIVSKVWCDLLIFSQFTQLYGHNSHFDLAKKNPLDFNKNLVKSIASLRFYFKINKRVKIEDERL